MLNLKDIAKRFFLSFPNIKSKDVASLFRVSEATVSEWKAGKRAIPNDVLAYVVGRDHVSWDWLLEGRGPVQAGNAGPDPNVLLVGQWQKNGVMRKVHIQIYEDD